MFIKRFIFNMVLLSLIVASIGFGQEAETGGRAGSFLQSGVGVRAVGMGAAFSAVADDGSTLFWNPAGLTQLESMEFTFMHSVMFEDRTKSYASVSVPFDKFTISAGWFGLQVGNIQERDETGQLIGHFNDSENVFMVGGGVPILSNYTIDLHLGVTGKYFYHSLYNYSAQGFGADVGVLAMFRTHISLLNRIGFAAVIQNYSSQIKWNTESGYQATIPVRYRAGTMFHLRAIPVKLSVEAESNLLETDFFQPYDFRYGVEYDMDVLALRAGYNQGQLTAGIGFDIPLSSMDIGTDYAYTTDKISSQGLHYFSLSIKY